MRTQISVSLLEFEDGGNTIWVHNSQGATVLRIKCAKVTVKPGCENICAHSDISVAGPVEFCVPDISVRTPLEMEALKPGITDTCEQCGKQIFYSGAEEEWFHTEKDVDHNPKPFTFK